MSIDKTPEALNLSELESSLFYDEKEQPFTFSVDDEIFLRVPTKSLLNSSEYNNQENINPNLNSSFCDDEELLHVNQKSDIPPTPLYDSSPIIHISNSRKQILTSTKTNTDEITPMEISPFHGHIDQSIQHNTVDPQSLLVYLEDESENVETSNRCIDIQANVEVNEIVSANIIENDKNSSAVHENLSIVEKSDFLISNEELELARVQVKALSFRQLALEKDLENAIISKNQEIERVEQLYKQSIDELNQKNNETIKQLNNINELRYLESQEQIQKLKIALSSQKETFLEYENKILKQHEIEIQTAKQQVYDKVKAQFDAGNKEFQKLRNQLRVTETEANKNNQTALENKKLFSSSKARVSFLSELIVSTLSILSDSNNQSEIYSTLAWEEMDLNDLASLSTTVKSIIKDQVDREKSLNNQLESLQQSSFVTEGLLNRRNQDLINMQLENTTLLDRARVAEALLHGCKGDLAEAIRGRDEAKLKTENFETSNLEMENKIQVLSKSVKDLEGRCNRLRTMNEELVGMLEAKTFGNQ